MKRLLVWVGIGLLTVAPLVAAAASSGSTSDNLPPAVDQMLARDMIQQAEAQLKIAGFDPGRVDGIFDAQTGEALRNYQAAKGLPMSGLLDEPTRIAMFPGFHDADGE